MLGAARVSKNGASVGQLMAIFGWRDLKSAQRYIEKFDRQAASFKGVRLLRPTGRSKRENGRKRQLPPTSPTSKKALFHWFF